MNDTINLIELCEMINSIVYDRVLSRVTNGENVFDAYRKVIDDAEANFAEYKKDIENKKYMANVVTP